MKPMRSQTKRSTGAEGAGGVQVAGMALPTWLQSALLTFVVLGGVHSAEAQWFYPPQAFLNPMWHAAANPYPLAAMAATPIRQAPSASCHPSRSSLYGNAWSASHARELSRAETYYEKKRIRQRYMDEQNARTLKTSEDVAALREHYDSVRALLDIKREMAADRSQAAMSALAREGQIRTGRPAKSTASSSKGIVRLAALGDMGHVWNASSLSSSQPANAWVSADGQRHFEAKLIQCKQGIVMLKRDDNGDVVHLPVADLHPVSQRALITGIQWGRVWRDCSKSHSVVARMLRCQHQQVTLLKPDGSLLHVALAALSDQDRAFAVRASSRSERPNMLCAEELGPVAPHSMRFPFDANAQ